MVRSAAMISAPSISTKYLMYTILSPELQNQIQYASKQTAQANLFQGAIANLILPLPPLSEQKRIVSAIEKAFEQIDIIEKNKLNLKTYIKQTKSKVLDLAIHGKLVEQNPQEGNAFELLEKIRNEKAELIKQKKLKEDKKASFIIKADDGKHYEQFADGSLKDVENEIPFEIPENWCWCRLSDFCNLYTGNSINETEKKTKYTKLKEGRFYIGTKDVGFDSVINYDNGVRIPFENDIFRIADTNTILMCIEGGSAGRKIAFTNQPVCFGNKLCCFDAYKKESIRFLYYFMQSTLFTDLFKDNMNGIIGGVSVNTLKTMLLPLPPLSEQKRIVEAIEQLLPLCEKLGK